MTHSSNVTKSSFNNGNTSTHCPLDSFFSLNWSRTWAGKKGNEVCIYTNNLSNCNYFHFLTCEQTLAKGREEMQAIMMQCKSPS